jgi:hypothetical protein
MLYGLSMKTISLTNAKCRFCNHEWIRRTPKPLRCPQCGRKQGKILVTLALGAVLLLGASSASALDLNAHLTNRYDANAQYACNLYQRAARAHYEGLLTDEAYRHEYQRVLGYAVLSNVALMRDIVAAHHAQPEAYSQHATTLWNYCARVPTSYEVLR